MPHPPTPASSPHPARPHSGEQVQSLVRALALLNRIAEAGEEGVSLSDLALQAGLPPSTAHRLLTTLEQERYVHFDQEGRLWSIGVQAFVVGSTFTQSRNMAALARPHMRRLMKESGETVNLAIEDQGEMVYLAQVECQQMMRAFARPGTRVALYCSAVGKAVLSATSNRTLGTLLGRRGMARITAKTITSPAALRADVEQVRTRGYAVDDEEHAVGLRCVAAPVFDDSGAVVAALSISGPMARIGDERLGELGTMVRQVAGRLSAEMGAFPGTDRPG